MLTAEGARQYGAVEHDEVKAEMIANRSHDAHWVRTQEGVGEIFYTTLFVKLVSLAMNKFALLDPCGMGVEMEANKPGWYDALNGLPGVFGSSMPETYELRRLLLFLQESMVEQKHKSVDFPREIYDFLRTIVERTSRLLGRTDSATNVDFGYWDEVARVREAYRDKVWMGFDGEMMRVALEDLDAWLGGDVGEGKCRHFSRPNLHHRRPPHLLFLLRHRLQPTPHPRRTRSPPHSHQRV